jgi:hypothetical protein
LNNKETYSVDYDLGIETDLQKQLSYIPQMSLQFSQFFLPSFFLKTFFVTQRHFLKISHDFLSFTFIENFQLPFSEASVEILTAEFRIILKKNNEKKVTFLKTTAERRNYDSNIVSRKLGS